MGPNLFKPLQVVLILFETAVLVERLDNEVDGASFHLDVKAGPFSFLNQASVKSLRLLSALDCYVLPECRSLVYPIHSLHIPY